MPTMAQLMDALPEPAEGIAAPAHGVVPERLEDWALRPVPVGAFRRLRVLGTMHAEIGAAYLFLWLRGWFNSAAEKERLAAETQWSTALRVLDSMSYLRGATMKIGQTLANFPDIVPRAFVETLERLHYDAPPMHWSLLKEMVHNELGGDPEDRFASFDKRAFAAASLGQVHRARLKTGEEVAVKIQYPGIARTIRQDFRNLFFFLLPGPLQPRLGEHAGSNSKTSASAWSGKPTTSRKRPCQERVRKLFREDDGIVVPRVYPRILHGPRADDGLSGGKDASTQFVATNPSQEERNEFARKILRAWYRMLYAGRLFYADIHPGNFLFLDDGRLGLIDFGFMMELDDTLWERFRKIDRPQTTGRRDERIAAMKEWI